MIRVVELFSGIGAQRMALMQAGIPFEVVAVCEINKHALASYKAIYGDCPNLGDITKVEDLPPCDLVTYSFPCQDLSLAGKRKGMGEGTRSGLVWEVVRLLESERERPEWLLMENVPQVLTSPLWGELVGRLEAMGYRNRWAKLDSSRFGSAQKRVRAFMVSRLGAEPPELPTEDCGAPSLCLRDIMEPTRDERFMKRIPLDRIRWREPKEGYRHPQSEGIRSPLIDAAVPRLEDRRIMAEGSLAPTLRGSGGCDVVEEEEERVRPLVGRADNLRMAPRGRMAIGTVRGGEVIMTVAPSDKAGESTPTAEDTGESFYTRRMIYSSSSSPTLRAFHSLKDMVKVVEARHGSSTPVAEVEGVIYYPERSLYSQDGSSPTVCTDHGNNRIQVIADWQREGRLDLANRIYSQDGASPAMVCHNGGNRDVKVVEGIEGRLQDVPPMEEGDVCPIQTPARAKKGQNGTGIRGPGSPAYTLTTEPDGAVTRSGGDLIVSILTPRECWRLMGFPEWAYLRASRVSSETQLYNQAGNSIVVEVLEAIFRTMFSDRRVRRQTCLKEFAEAEA